MTQKDKKLLLKDLCARLPYGVVCSIYREDDFKIGWRNEKLTGYFFDDFSYEFYFGESPISVDNILKIKPYLRPMSSMTEEEIKTYRTLQDTACSYHYDFGDIVDDFLYFDNDASLDYLNSIHIDYRGIIEKGVALEAPEDMYNLA